MKRLERKALEAFLAFDQSGHYASAEGACESMGYGFRNRRAIRAVHRCFRNGYLRVAKVSDGQNDPLFGITEAGVTALRETNTEARSAELAVLAAMSAAPDGISMSPTMIQQRAGLAGRNARTVWKRLQTNGWIELATIRTLDMEHHRETIETWRLTDHGQQVIDIHQSTVAHKAVWP